MHDHLHFHARRDHSQMRPESLHENAASNQKKDNSEDEAGVATVVSVVYVTAEASFTGPTAGYVTEGAPETTAKAVSTPQTTAEVTKQPQKTPAANIHTTVPTTAVPKNVKSSETSVSSILSSISQESSISSQHTTLATLTSTSPNRLAGTPIAATRATSSATASPSETSAPSSGMTGAAKAGVAFGLLAGIALVAGAVFFFVRRRKQQDEDGHERLADEKSANSFSEKPTNSSTASKAPRLSLRPMTQMMSSLNDRNITEMTSATGGLASSRPQSNVPSAWERRPSTANSNDHANPFGNNAATVDHAAADKAAENAPIPVPAAVTLNPFADGRAKSPEAAGSAITTPNPPPRGEIGTASAVPMGAQSSRAPPNNVHRVQLDFKPSMDDELELRAGQVVRVLHEYDDGWALCMRMDRSKQGVAPRTCLSKMPIKPRPMGPPPLRPNGRPTAQGMRNASGPPGGPGPRNPMYPAPLSPSVSSFSSVGSRPPMSPQREGRQRSNSYTQSGGPGPMPRPAGPPSGPASPREHRRSASAGQLLATSPRNIPSRKPVPGSNA